MIGLPTISKIAVFFINVFGITLIFSVLLSDLSKKLKIIFTLMGILMFIWVDFAFLARISSDPRLSLISIRLAWSITPLLFILIYSFIVNFLHVSDKYKYLTISLYVLGIMFIPILMFTGEVISNINFVDEVLNIRYGRLVWLFFLTIALLTSINFYLLFKTYISKNIESEKRKKIKFLLLGLTFFFVANAIFNIFFPFFLKRFNLYEFGDYSTIIFLTVLAYATVRHEFLGTKVVASIFLVIFLGSFLLIDAVLLTVNPSNRIIKFVILIIYFPFGYFLVRSVLVEVRQKEELEELTKKLQYMDKQKDEFVSMAAHELRAPMTAIKGYLSMVLEGDAGEIPEKARGYIADVSSITDRLTRLVNNMLNVSRIEEGRLVYQVEVINLSRVAHMVFSQFKIEAERKRLQMELEIPKNLKDTVRVDVDRIQEVMANFVSNAVKYTDDGKVFMRLKQVGEDRVRFEVEDTGPGISKEEQKNLFQKFYRAESNVGKTIGTGLGLYICKLLIDNFNGELGLESEPDKGSTFWFELPVVDQKEGEDLSSGPSNDEDQSDQGN